MAFEVVDRSELKSEDKELAAVEATLDTNTVVKKDLSDISNIGNWRQLIRLKVNAKGLKLKTRIDKKRGVVLLWVERRKRSGEAA